MMTVIDNRHQKICDRSAGLADITSLMSLNSTFELTLIHHKSLMVALIIRKNLNEMKYKSKEFNK